GLFQGEPAKLMFLAAVFLTVDLQFMIIYLPPLQGFFHTRALSGEEILLCLGLSSLIFSAVEIEKAIIRRRGEGEGASLETWNPNLETFS
ncbi:MAG: cation-translocating P-type ATPase C-terminal domain-containing protein, partial [Deltaproteobacteria bacterium]|nr:cation-translocating P-type ATPase C-terminal domain-containing protein [Deltaproteobacteria bacterium]